MEIEPTDLDAVVTTDDSDLIPVPVDTIVVSATVPANMRTLTDLLVDSYRLVRTPANDLRDIDEEYGIDAWLDKLAEVHGEPTFVNTTQSGVTHLWMESGGLARGWLDIPRIGIRLGANLNKRATVFNRPFPVQVQYRTVVFVRCALIEVDGKIVGFKALDRVPAPKPGQVVVGIAPEDKRLDGMIVFNRSIVDGGIASTVKSLAKSDQQKSKKVKRRLDRCNIWSVRILVPDFGDGQGGFIKGHGLATNHGMELAEGVDIFLTQDNLKKEMYTTDGSCIFLADGVEDHRDIRWTDRQTLIHHSWFLKARIFPAFRQACQSVLRAVLNNEEPAFSLMQRMSVEREMAKDSINTFLIRYRYMLDHQVLSMSTSAVSGLVSRWNKMVAPKKDRQGKVLEDSRKFPVVASEFRPVRPLAYGAIAGYPVDLDMAEGYWTSTPFGVTCAQRTADYLAVLSGGADWDDEWPEYHIRSLSACKLPLWKGATVSVEAGQIVTLFARLPIGTSSNGVELASEYMVLVPTADEVVRLEELNPVIPTVDLKDLPTRKDQLKYRACPKACADKADHSFGHPTWTATPMAFVDQTYTLRVVSQLCHGLVAAIGAVGARANLEMVMYQHGIVYPWRCHTEGWVDLFTKSVPNPVDITFWRQANADDADLIRTASRAGNPIDKYSFARIRRHYHSNFHGVKTTSGLFSVCKTEHSNAIAALAKDTGIALRGIRESNRALLKGTKFTTVSRRATPGWDGHANGNDGYAENSGENLPPLMERVNLDNNVLFAAAKELDGSKERLSAPEWDQVGNMTLTALRAAGLSDDDVKQEIRKSLAWIYQVRGEKRVWTDQWLLNGPLLELTVAVLEAIRDGSE